MTENQIETTRMGSTAFVLGRDRAAVLDAFTRALDDAGAHLTRHGYTPVWQEVEVSSEMRTIDDSTLTGTKRTVQNPTITVQLLGTKWTPQPVTAHLSVAKTD